MITTFENTYKTYEEAMAVKTALKAINFANSIGAIILPTGEFKVIAQNYPAERMDPWN